MAYYPPFWQPSLAQDITSFHTSNPNNPNNLNNNTLRSSFSLGGLSKHRHTNPLSSSKDRVDYPSTDNLPHPSENVIKLPAGSYRGDVDAKGDLHGKGTMVFLDGSWYEGQWSNNKQNGHGEFVCSEWVYRGSFVNGQKDGLGTQDWQNGEFYEGVWKEGLRDGWGTYKSKNFFFEGHGGTGLMDGVVAWIIPGREG
eukprot:TRINITY_DN15088_c0_g1_i1.p1 TRINITY_DN15088_c0_g1~~TRINITY_DN15088_c0_g1_i1.p1  ORF type:complete len:197 (+),score=20.02 TRINITY_DN15088_c0_g1_i1:72-662(+)